MEPERSLPHSQEPASSPSLSHINPVHHPPPHNHFSEIHFPTTSDTYKNPISGGSSSSKTSDGFRNEP
jgi:hypothetical protein